MSGKMIYEVSHAKVTLKLAAIVVFKFHVAVQEHNQSINLYCYNTADRTQRSNRQALKKTTLKKRHVWWSVENAFRVPWKSNSETILKISLQYIYGSYDEQVSQLKQGLADRTAKTAVLVAI